MNVQLEAVNFILQIILLIVTLSLLATLWVRLHANRLISQLLLCQILLVTMVVLRRIDDIGALDGVDIISNEVFFWLSWVSVLAILATIWLLFRNHGAYLLRERRRQRKIDRLESLRAKRNW